ncbi:hypothetical protein UMC2_15661 [[Clostridium] sordellii]|uniref:hypothetical protein n=1 Tax=Paraclostridium sordellii TaxID=1505 RepID=UPI000542DE54|nr:hypothetical protein [Paeniclostridium sordellii]CEK34610.1 hypothetical protein UMC2_15661 [[Clostridium] sordellii] [Paeniclostridium sordellii]
MKNLPFLKLGFPKGLIQNPIEDKKKMRRIISESKRLAKKQKCFYCKKEVSSFCNSHSVPAFCLKNISSNGELYTFNALVNSPLFDSKKGVRNSGTFQIICKDCDSKIFQDYENPDNYIQKPTPKMIAQIAMKNYLKLISKRYHEHALYGMTKEINPSSSKMVDLNHKVQEMDLMEYIKSFEKAKRLSKKNWDGEYYLFYYETLDYVVPIAFQSSIALITDLDGQIINDIYYHDISYKLEDLHICILPLKESSVILMFIDSKNKRYRNFYKKFNKLTLEDKLSLINYIIFLYSEEAIFSKDIPNEVLKNKNLINISKQSSNILTTNPFIDPYKALREGYDLNKRNEIPNLLNEKYKLR